MEYARQFFIDGAWVDPLTSETLEVLNPATEQVIATIALAGEKDVDRAVTAARAAFDSFASTTREERAALLERIIEVYGRRASELAATLSQEMGAPIVLAEQRQVSAGAAHFAQGRSRRSRPSTPNIASERPPSSMSQSVSVLSSLPGTDRCT